METYRLSSKLAEKSSEYLIQTANDAAKGAVSTSIYVNGVLTETVSCPHPFEGTPEDVLSLVKLTHEQKKKELETLLQAYRRVLEAGNAEMLYQLGTAFLCKGFSSEAVELFRGAISLNEEYHQAVNGLCQAQLALGRVEDAIDAGVRATQMRPMFADYHFNLGEAYLADSQCPEATEEFQRAVEINMYYSDAYFGLAMAHLLHAILHPDRVIWPEALVRIRDYLHRASLIHAEYRTESFDTGLEALGNKELRRALAALRAVQDDKRSRARRDFASFCLNLAMFPDRMSERVIADRIKFLESRVKANPSYVDLQAELSQCYLEQARVMWQKGSEQYRRTYDMNPSLHKVRFAMEEAEQMYEEMCISIKKISEQG